MEFRTHDTIFLYVDLANQPSEAHLSVAQW